MRVQWLGTTIPELSCFFPEEFIDNVAPVFSHTFIYSSGTTAKNRPTYSDMEAAWAFLLPDEADEALVKMNTIRASLSKAAKAPLTRTAESATFASIQATRRLSHMILTPSKVIDIANRNCLPHNCLPRESVSSPARFC